MGLSEGSNTQLEPSMVMPAGVVTLLKTSAAQFAFPPNRSEGNPRSVLGRPFAAPSVILCVSIGSGLSDQWKLGVFEKVEWHGLFRVDNDKARRRASVDGRAQGGGVVWRRGVDD